MDMRLTCENVGGPNGIRTRATALKGRRPDLARRWGLRLKPTRGPTRLSPSGRAPIFRYPVAKMAQRYRIGT